MFWSKTIAQIKKELKKIANGFSSVRGELAEIKESIASRKEIDLMIRNAILKHSLQVQQGAKVKDRPVQVALPIKLKKVYKKNQILKEMQNLSNQGYSVTEIEEAIINKFGISRRTFYNYKKKLVVKVHLH